MTTQVDIQAGQKGKNNGESPCFALKGGMLTTIEMHLFDPTLANLPALLKKKISQAPDFLNRAPVIIDLSQLKNTETAIDFAELAAVLKRNNLIPVGVRNGNSDQHKHAEDEGLLRLPASSGYAEDAMQKAANQASSSGTTTAAESPAAVPTGKASYSKTITQPVRSGQQIYARGCDLVVLSTVSAGADIVADGHIHVYGALRGRALAGVNGDTSARIFCRNLEAQLISIAGYYRVIEEIEENVRNQAVQIYLKDERLTIEKL